MNDFDWEAMFSADQNAADLIFGAFAGVILGLAVTNRGVNNSDYASLAQTLIFFSVFVYFNNGLRALALRKQWRLAAVYALVSVALGTLISILVPRLGVPSQLMAVTLSTWLFVPFFDIVTRSFSRRRFRD